MGLLVEDTVIRILFFFYSVTHKFELPDGELHGMQGVRKNSQLFKTTRFSADGCC